MKYKHLTLLLSLLSVCGFANEELSEDKLVSSFLSRKEIPVEKITDKKPLNKGYFYFKGGMSPNLLGHGPAPLYGLGYRSRIFSSLRGTIDLTIYEASIKVLEKDRATVSTYLPTLAYHYYFSHKKNKSFYLGAGASFAVYIPEITTYENPSEEQVAQMNEEVLFSAFVGTNTMISFGYNPDLHAKFLHAIQLDLSFPLANMNEYTTRVFNGPSIGVSFIVGY